MIRLKPEKRESRARDKWRHRAVLSVGQKVRIHMDVNEVRRLRDECNAHLRAAPRRAVR